MLFSISSREIFRGSEKDAAMFVLPDGQKEQREIMSWNVLIY